PRDHIPLGVWHVRLRAVFRVPAAYSQDCQLETVSAPLYAPDPVDVVEQGGVLKRSLHGGAERPVVVRPDADELADGDNVAYAPWHGSALPVRQVIGSVYSALVLDGDDPAIGGREHEESIGAPPHPVVSRPVHRSAPSWVSSVTSFRTDTACATL